MDDLDLEQEGDQQQRSESGGEVGGSDGQDEQAVEVDAAEVGAQPAGPREPVGVGDVGVEGWPGDVDAGAHLSGVSPTGAQAAGVPRLVERGTGQHQAEHHQEQVRLVHRRAGALPDAVDEEEPDVEGHECGEHDDDDPGREQRCEQSGDGVDHALRNDTCTHPQREEGIAGRDLGVGTVGRGGQPGAAQLGVDDALDVRRVEAGVACARSLRRRSRRGRASRPSTRQRRRRLGAAGRPSRRRAAQDAAGPGSQSWRTHPAASRPRPVAAGPAVGCPRCRADGSSRAPTGG